MRIIKYIFLLILLALVALSVFVATQKGDYDIVRSKVIKSPKSVIFNYVNDYRNWENWGSWKENDPEMTFSYPEKTIGSGGSYSWIGKEGDGNMKTIFVKGNDSIFQKMNSNGSVSEVFWSFKDTVGGTTVTWRTKGKMPFMFKIYAYTKGGADKIIGNMYEKSLVNLDKALFSEIDTYSIKVDGKVTKLGTYYLHHTITSKISNLSTNLKAMLPNIIRYAKDNNVAINGKPFVIYNTYDVVNGLTNFSVCIPTKDEIVTRPESKIKSGKFATFQAIKTTLTGDYSHRKEAWDKTEEFITTNNLVKNPLGPALETYIKGIKEEKSPSKWITEIYIALKSSDTIINTITVVNPPIIVPAVEPKSDIQSRPVIQSKPVIQPKSDTKPKSDIQPKIVKPVKSVKKPDNQPVKPVNEESDTDEFDF